MFFHFIFTFTSGANLAALLLDLMFISGANLAVLSFHFSFVSRANFYSNCPFILIVRFVSRANLTVPFFIVTFVSHANLTVLSIVCYVSIAFNYSCHFILTVLFVSYAI